MNAIYRTFQWAVTYLTGKDSAIHTNIIIAVAMILNVFAAFFLWLANMQTAKITKLMFLNQFRPHISIDPEVRYEPVVGPLIDLKVLKMTIRNSGQSAANISLIDFQERDWIGEKERWFHLIGGDEKLTIPANGVRERGFPMLPIEELRKQYPRKFFYYRIEIYYRGTDKKYYRHTEERVYDELWKKFNLITNYNTEYTSIQYRYQRQAKRISDSLNRLSAKYRSNRANQKDNVKRAIAKNEKQENNKA